MNKTSTQRTASDEMLIERAQRGDGPAFEQVVSRHRSQALNLAARICGRGDAEDAVQAAFLSLWRNLDGYSPERASVKAWLLSIVRNRAIDVLRARPDAVVGSIETRGEQEDPVRTESIVARREQSAEVRRAVAELPEPQRQVLELAYFREFSQSEIASALRLPLGTVKGRARLGMRKLPGRLAAMAPAAG